MNAIAQWDGTREEEAWETLTVQATYVWENQSLPIEEKIGSKGSDMQA